MWCSSLDLWDCNACLLSLALYNSDAVWESSRELLKFSKHVLNPLGMLWSTLCSIPLSLFGLTIIGATYQFKRKAFLRNRPYH